MSAEDFKVKHSKRLHQKLTHMLKQVRIRRNVFHFNEKYEDMEEAHRYHKTSGTTCGNPNCFMCGNPRKFFGEKTIQEKRFVQKQLHDGDYYEPCS